MNRLFILSFVILCYSCSRVNNNVDETMVVYDSISISIDFPFISDYVQIHPYVNGDTLFLLGYNHLMHSLDLIDISTGKNHKSIELEKEGDNGVYNVSSINGSQGNFAVMELTGLKWLSSDGEVLKNIPLLEFVDSITSNSYSLMNKGLSPGNYIDFAYCVENRSCFLPMASLKNVDPKMISVGLMADLSSGCCRILECSYPAPYNKNYSNLGTFFRAQFSVMDTDRVIFNFYGNSHFWIYNTNTSELVENDMPSLYTENEAKYLNSSGTLLEDEYTSLRFRPIHYIPSLKSFVRIHHAAKKDLKDMSNKGYLMYMGENDNKCVEYMMPSSFNGRYFVHNTSLYFLLKGSNDSEIKLGVVNLEKIGNSQ